MEARGGAPKEARPVDYFMEETLTAAVSLSSFSAAFLFRLLAHSSM